MSHPRRALLALVIAAGIRVALPTPAMAAPCPHDRCVPGAAMGDPACDDECAALVCGIDPYCCHTEWDEQCVAAVGATCGPPGCARCGDGRVAAPEVCDPPGGSAGCPGGEVCAGNCLGCTRCGNGANDPGEICD